MARGRGTRSQRLARTKARREGGTSFSRSTSPVSQGGLGGGTPTPSAEPIPIAVVPSAPGTTPISVSRSLPDGGSIIVTSTGRVTHKDSGGRTVRVTQVSSGEASSFISGTSNVVGGVVASPATSSTSSTQLNQQQRESLGLTEQRRDLNLAGQAGFFLTPGAASVGAGLFKIKTSGQIAEKLSPSITTFPLVTGASAIDLSKEKIKEEAKGFKTFSTKLFEKVDTKVGGVLPGGVDVDTKRFSDALKKTTHEDLGEQIVQDVKDIKFKDFLVPEKVFLKSVGIGAKSFAFGAGEIKSGIGTLASKIKETQAFKDVKLESVKADLRKEATTFSVADTVIPQFKAAKIVALGTAVSVGQFGKTVLAGGTKKIGEFTDSQTLIKLGEGGEEKPFKTVFGLAALKLGFSKQKQILQGINLPLKSLTAKTIAGKFGFGVLKGGVVLTEGLTVSKLIDSAQPELEKSFLTTEERNLLKKEGVRESIEEITFPARKTDVLDVPISPAGESKFFQAIEPGTTFLKKYVVRGLFDKSIEGVIPSLKTQPTFDKTILEGAKKDPLLSQFDPKLVLSTAKGVERAESGLFTLKLIGAETTAEGASLISPTRGIAGGQEIVVGFDAILDRYKELNVFGTGGKVKASKQFKPFEKRIIPGTPSYSSFDDPTIKTKTFDVTAEEFELQKGAFESRTLTPEQFKSKDFENIIFNIRGTQVSKTETTDAITSVTTETLRTEKFGFERESTPARTETLIGKSVSLPILYPVGAGLAVAFRGFEIGVSKLPGGKTVSNIVGNVLDFPEELLGDVLSGSGGAKVGAFVSAFTAGTTQPDPTLSFTTSHSFDVTSNVLGTTTQTKTKTSIQNLVDSFSPTKSVTIPTTKTTGARDTVRTSPFTSLFTDTPTTVKTKVDVFTKVDNISPVTDTITSTFSNVGTTPFTSSFTNTFTETFTNVFTPSVPLLPPRGGGGFTTFGGKRRKQKRRTRFLPSISGLITGRGAKPGQILTGLEGRVIPKIKF